MTMNRTSGGSRAAKRAFTLIELMIVVAMVGIMAAIAGFGIRYYIKTARTGHTKDLMAGIMYAQHVYYQDTQGYLNCSSSWIDYYPHPPSASKASFHNPAHDDYACWRMLAPDADSGSYVAFTMRAGTATDGPPAPPTDQAFAWPVPTGPWYILLGTADQDEDGEYAYWVGSSFQPDVHAENDTE